MAEGSAQMPFKDPAATPPEVENVPQGAHTVHKVGGTSMARAKEMVDNILLGNGGDGGDDDVYNRIFVVSAYAGFTDLLLENKKTGEPGVYGLFASAESDWSWGDGLTALERSMRKKNAEVLDDRSDVKLADDMVRERIEGTRSCMVDLHRLCTYGHFRLEEHLLTVREMLSSIGEAHSAFNTVLMLRRRGVDAAFVDLSGWRDDGSYTLDERIREAFEDIDVASQLPVVTGYAQCSEGLMGLYGRGYSEVTFSRIACMTRAREAVIHKEFHLSSADPKIVGTDAVRIIGHTNYDVADQLSNMGMEAIHPRAAKGLRQLGIPLRVANTFDPDNPGTSIVDGWRPEKPKVEIVTGLPAAFEIEVFDQDIVGVPGADEHVTAALKRFRVSTVAKSLNANTITHYVAEPLKQVRRCVEEIRKHHPDAEIETRKVSLVSVIGANINAPAIFARAVRALQEEGIEMIACHYPSRGVDIQFVVPESAYADAVKALHQALVEDETFDVGEVSSESGTGDRNATMVA